jgi:hypothetical protein
MLRHHRSLEIVGDSLSKVEWHKGQQWIEHSLKGLEIDDGMESSRSLPTNKASECES